MKVHATSVITATFMLVTLGACSSDVSDDLVFGGALAPPTNLVGTALPNGTGVVMTWLDRATAETGYRLDVSDVNPIVVNSDITFGLVLPANTTGVTYATTPGQTYYFQVVATTSTHQSQPTNMITVNTPVLPIAVNSLSVATVSTTQLDLTWVDISSETGYRLERRDEGMSTWNPLITLLADTTTHSDIGLATGTEYCYRLIAFNGNGDGPTGNEACAPTSGLGMTITTVTSPWNGGRHTALALDASENIHISHYDSSFTNLLYTNDTIGTYTTTLADSGPAPTSQVGSDGTGIAIDVNGFVHMAASEYNNGDLRYVTNESSSLVATTIDSVGFVGSQPVLRVRDADLTVHIVYTADGTLKRAIKAAGSWSFEVFTPSELLGDLDFVLDSTGNAHVVYVRWVNPGGGLSPELIYTENTSGSWSETIVTTAGDPEFVSIAADSGGAPHIVYNETDTQGLHYTTESGGTWTSEVIDQTLGIWTGRFNAMVIETTPIPGRLHVSYQDFSNRDLRYARKDPGGAWIRRLVDEIGLVGSYTSIDLDSGGGVHISYEDESSNDLKVASGTP